HQLGARGDDRRACHHRRAHDDDRRVSRHAGGSEPVGPLPTVYLTQSASLEGGMANAKKKSGGSVELDPIVMSVIANRLDGIVREMTNTLLRAARSVVISSARDFSCCIITGDNQLLASAEGLPVHIFGAHLQAANMC